MKLSTSKHDFEVRDILNEAWNLVNGSKWPILAVALCIGVASLIIQFSMITLFRINPEMPPVHYNYFFMPLINSIVIAPFFAGGVMTAIKASAARRYLCHQ